METHDRFLQGLECEVNRARRHGMEFGILVVRLDHPEKERFTDETAAILGRTLRNYDRIAHHDDLEILLCDVDSDGLHVVAERILSRIREHGFADGKIRLTASAGGASFPQDGVAPNELLKRALEALQEAGQGRYVKCRPISPPGRTAESDRLAAIKPGRTVLGMISRLLKDGGDVEAMLRQTLDLMAKAVDADAGLIFLLQDGARLRAVLNMPDRPFKLESDDYSTNVLRRAITTARPVRVEDVEKDAWASGLESVQELGVTSILVVPIVVGPKVLGTVYLDIRRKGRSFTREDEELLGTFSELIAGPVEQGAELRRKAEEVARLEDVVRSGLSELGTRYHFGAIVGRSDLMRQVFAMIERIAPIPYPVILVGETGTGKELVAKAIHFNGPRKDRPFLPVNCGAIAETLLESHLFGHVKGAFTGAEQARPGLFEAAGGGTLFLDEVEEMSDAMQKKILRVLEESQVWRVGASEPIKVDVRVVAATNQEIQDLVEEGKFRRDLYYRLNTFVLRLPPLRERAEDIPLIVDHFLEEIAKDMKSARLRITPEAMAFLMRYPWPGNVRELRNELRKLGVLTRGEVGPGELPLHIRETTGSIARDLSLRDRLGEVDRSLILEALDRHEWNISRAAEDLGINRNTLKTRMRKYGIRKGDHPSA